VHSLAMLLLICFLAAVELHLSVTLGHQSIMSFLDLINPLTNCVGMLISLFFDMHQTPKA